MSGFDNDVMYADNVDFSGAFPVSGQINQDGELLVGSSVAPNIRSYVPTGSNGVDINVGQGTIDFNLSNIPSSALQDSSISLSGGSNITVTGSPVSLGGAGVIAVSGTTNHAVQVGNSTGSLTSLGTGSTGQVLQSAGASSDPAYSTATYPSTAGSSGKILISDGTNIVSSTPTYPNAASTSGKVVISNGTNFVTSTPTFPNASASSGKFIRSDGTNWIESTPTLPTSAGTSGKVLQSNGTNYVESTPTYPSSSGSSGKVLISDGTNNVYSTPTFPNASATSGKIIKSDGTNWTASTETYAAPGTSGNVLTSDGTNWTSAAPAGGGKGFTFTSGSNGGNPADGITYYASNLAKAAITTYTASNQWGTRWYIPVDCTLTNAYGAFNVAGTLGSAQNVTIAVRKNDTSNTNITTTLQLTAANGTFNNTGLSTAFTAGDFIDLLMICPTWSTNPTTVAIFVTMYFA